MNLISKHISSSACIVLPRLLLCCALAFALPLPLGSLLTAVGTQPITELSTMQEQNLEANSRASAPHQRTILSVDALRRSSPHVAPSRTLRLSEAEHALSSREGPSPLRVAIEALSNRPRSNPRNRTPRRYESPLNPDEFRRVSLTDDDDADAPSAAWSTFPPVEDQLLPGGGPRRITIRPLAGSAVGTTVSTRVSTGSLGSPERPILPSWDERRIH